MEVEIVCLRPNLVDSPFILASDFVPYFGADTASAYLCNAVHTCGRCARLSDQGGKWPAGNQNTIACMGQFERIVLIGRRALSVASPTDNLS